MTMAANASPGRMALTASQRGHEAAIVQPSSYLLRPSPALSLPMNPPEKAIDREERHGLVSLSVSLCLPCLPQIAPPVAVRHSIFVFVPAVEIATDDQRLTAVACHSQLPQSPQQLRCPAAELPSHRLRYLAVCQGEFEYPDPEWYACLGQMDLHTHTDSCLFCRNRFGSAMGLQSVGFRWPPNHLRLYQCHPVLLPEPRRFGPDRPVPPGQSPRCVNQDRPA